MIMESIKNTLMNKVIKVENKPEAITKVEVKKRLKKMRNYMV